MQIQIQTSNTTIAALNETHQ